MTYSFDAKNQGPTQTAEQITRDEDGARSLIAALTAYGTGGGSTALLTGQAIAAAEMIAALQSERERTAEMVAKIKALPTWADSSWSALLAILQEWEAGR